MRLCGVTRVKNGGKWLREHLESTLRVCERVLVLDNHSTDDTVSICEDFAPRVEVITNPSTAFNEAADKMFLVSNARHRFNPDWCLFLDADEVLIDPEALLENIDRNRGGVLGYRVRIWSCWDSPDQVRVDGIYGKCWRASCFKMNGDFQWHQRELSGPNIHCGSIPSNLHQHAMNTSPEVRVKHYGYMLREDRIRKFNWYREIDKSNRYTHAEDGYRHSVQGDLPEFPADAQYRHGGPLTLARFPQQGAYPEPVYRWVGNQQVIA